MVRRLTDERGDSLILVALSLLVLLGLLALAIDVGFAYSERRHMQNAADAGALAGAAVMMTGGTDAEILAAVDEYVRRNTAQTFEAHYTIENNPVGVVGGGSVPNDATGIQVRAVVDFPTFLAYLVGTNQIEAHGDSIGGFGPLDIVMVLDRSGSMDDDSCDLREAQCSTVDPRDAATCNQCRGNWSSGRCDIAPSQLWPGHTCNLTTQTGCTNCRGVWVNPPMPITEVRRAANTFVDRNNRNLSHLALVSYSTGGRLDQPLTNNLPAVKDAIDRVGTPYPSGCTNAADGIKKAWQELIGPRQRADAARFIVFLTDGLPNYPQCPSCPSNPGACPAAMGAAVVEATTAANNRIVVYTIGLGRYVDHQFLRDVAGVSGGEYFYAPSAYDLEAIYQTIFERIQLRLTQ